MRRFNWAALAGAILAALSLNQPAAKPPVESPAPELTWTVVFSKAPPPASQPPGGSRGNAESIYALAPGQMGRAAVWSSQPLFVWQGAIRQLELITAAGAVVWSQSVEAGRRILRYSDAALQPGQTYEWILYNSTKAAVARAAFQIVAGAEREQITADLQALTTQFSNAIPERIALQRANYFANQQLWADVLQEAFSVVHPSAELRRFLQPFEAG